MTTRILVSHADPDATDRWVEALRGALPDSYDVVTQADADIRHLVTWAPPEDLFARLPALQSCFSAAAGVDHLLGNPALPPQLPVYRLLDAGMAAQMVRYCRHEIERRLLAKPLYEAQQRDRQWIEHPAMAPSELSVGILGFGVLGREVAHTLAREGYRVTAFRRQPVDDVIEVDERHRIELIGGDARWPAFLARSDVLILLAPLTPQTRHLIDAAALARLPAGAILINVARGGLVDTDALLDALGSGHLAGASLDVFEQEPLPANSRLWRTPGIRLTPHVSALTLIKPSARQIAASIVAFDAGEPVPGRVERDRGY